MQEYFSRAPNCTFARANCLTGRVTSFCSTKIATHVECFCAHNADWANRELVGPEPLPDSGQPLSI